MKNKIIITNLFIRKVVVVKKMGCNILDHVKICLQINNFYQNKDSQLILEDRKQTCGIKEQMIEDRRYY